MGVQGTHDLLVNIIDPSRAVDDEHRTWNIALRNGSFATGIIGRENEKSVTLRLPGGVEQEIKVADIKSDSQSMIYKRLSGSKGTYRATALTGPKRGLVSEPFKAR